MTASVYTNARLWLDQFNQSGDHNALALDLHADVKDVTALGDTSRSNIAGLKFFSASASGYFQAGTGMVDEVLAARLGASDVLMTLDPTGAGGADGDRVYLGPVLLAQYAFGAAVGAVLPFTAGLTADGSVIQGTLLHNAVRSASGTGTILAVGAVPAGRSMVAQLHLLSLTGGGSLTVTVQSAALVGFGSPASRISFAAQSAPIALSSSVAGAVTDTFWRVSWTLTGASPSTEFVVSLGLL